MPKDGSIVPLFGTSNKGLSPVVTSQRRMNLYVEMPRDSDKGQIALYPRPGLSDYTVLPEAADSFGARGFSESFRYETPFDGFKEYGIVAGGDAFCLVTSTAGSAGTIGSLLTSSGPVVFAQNPTQILAVDGRTGYIIDKTTLSITSLEGLSGADWFPAGATTCTFIAGRFVVNQPNTGKFWYSDLNDGLTGSALNFYTAESDPDSCRAVMADHGELVVFGEFTTEFWSPGSGTTTFQRVGGSGMEWGLAAVQSLRKADSGLLFIGQNRLGDLKVLRTQGYQAVPVSTPDIETRLQSLPTVADGVGMSFTANGHSFYVLSFPDFSLLYDATTNTWNEMSTGTEGDRWIGQYGVLLNGRYLVSDYQAPIIYTLEPDVMTDGGETITREVITRHVFSDYDRSSVYKLGVDFETGVGLVSGQGVDPQVMLQISRDNGRTWGNEVWQGLGALGNYIRRVWWTRLGRSRDWLFKLRITDPVKVVIAGGSLKVGP